MKTRTAWTTILLGVLLGACIATSEETDKGWVLAAKLYGDDRAHKVGDLLTVIIRESSSSSKDASSRTNKRLGLGGSVQVGHPTLDSQNTPWTNATIPAWNVQADRSFEGSGETENKDELKATLTVRVTEVLPNGTMLIEGKRTVKANGERIGFVLTGIVRPQDVTRDNTIESTSIADAHIEYFGQGAVIQNQRRGIITTLLDWINLF